MRPALSGSPVHLRRTLSDEHGVSNHDRVNGSAISHGDGSPLSQTDISSTSFQNSGFSTTRNGAAGENLLTCGIEDWGIEDGGDGSVAASFFNGNAETSEESEYAWRTCLMRYGSFSEADASRVAAVICEHDFPLPMPELAVSFTQELLEEIGVRKANDRVRVMMALARCPAIPNVLGSVEAAAVSDIEHLPVGYFVDIDRVHEVLVHASKNGGVLEWLDIVGKDDSQVEFKNSLRRLQEKFAKRMTAFEVTRVTGPGGSPTSKRHDGVADLTSGRTGFHLMPSSSRPRPEEPPKDHSLHDLQSEELQVLNVSGESPRANAGRLSGRAEESVDADVLLRRLSRSDAPASVVLVTQRPSPINTALPQDELEPPGVVVAGGMSAKSQPLPESQNDAFDIFDAPRPFPAFFASQIDPRYGSFVLRCPTPKVDFDEATIASLTNKWIVVLDSRTNLIATVHRIDSVSLTRLRQSPRLQKMALPQLLMAMFMSFIADFNRVIDEVVEVLDDCELRLLDKRQVQWLIDRLVHLQRRAGVYERLVLLNQSVVRRVGMHFGCRDVGNLEAHWSLVLVRCRQVDTRSGALLNLVLSLGGQRTTDVMTVLTKISMCISPLTLITGNYGMNFRVMPDLEWEYSYYVTLLGMAVVVVVMLMWMKYIGL